VSHRNLPASRLIVFAAAVAASVAVFAALGGVGLAHSAISLAQYQYGKLSAGKITICHKQHKTITIATRAWPAHQHHGDVAGPCTAAAVHGGRGHHDKGQHGNKGSEDTQQTVSGQQPSGAQTDTSEHGHSGDHNGEGHRK
jgi:hypothetical protein